MVHPSNNEENKKVERTQEQLNHDYANLLAQVGERTYRKDKLQSEINELFKVIDNLQQEAGKLQEKAKKLQEESKLKIVEDTKVVLDSIR